MKIQVLGTGCDKCDRLYENTCKAVQLLGLDTDVEKIEDLMEIVKSGIMTTPAVAVNGEAVIRNRVPSPSDIAELIRKKL